MPALSQRVAERTDLDPAEQERLQEILAEWSLIADLAMSDLVLWLPTWNDGGLVAAALVRPTTAPTSVPEDIVGTFAPRGRYPDLDGALTLGRVQAEAYPVHFGGRVIGVVGRHSAMQARVAGQLEKVYLHCAADLLTMLVAGKYPPSPAASSFVDGPRVGDGLIRCSPAGVVEFASPNAVSALRRLGVATNIEGRELRGLVARLMHRPGPMDERDSLVLAGRQAGRLDIENQSATVQLRGLPLEHDAQAVGSLFLLHDVTEIRRRERALVSKDATIREIHHRVKNNLQMVAALLRLQARRTSSDQARMALDEAQVRVAAIAVVHEALSRDTLDAVAFDDVLDRILVMLAELAPSHAIAGRVPTLRREGVSLVIPSDIATPLAMCVSELAHNAIEHAAANEIVIELTEDEDCYRAAVLDDGSGLPADFQADASGLGLQIVQTLAGGELGGTFRIEGAPGGGTVAAVEVPKRRIEPG